MSEQAQHNTRLAAGMLDIAQQRLLGTHPFHARFVATWHVQASATVRTMGVSVKDNGVVLYFDPTFVIGCSFPQLMGVLHHEIHHLLFGHVFMDPSHFPDHEALTIAQEVTANEWVPEPLPGAPILLAQFPQLPPNEETSVRYQRLARVNLDPYLQRIAGQMDQEMSTSVPNSSTMGPKLPQSGVLSPASKTLDDHSVWAETQTSGPLGKMTVRVLIRQAREALSPVEWQRLPPALRQSIDDACRGEMPGGGVELLTAMNTGHLDWRRLLRRYVRQATELRPGFTRPARRFPDLLGIVPGRLHHPTRATVLVAIDTSGSMSMTMLEMIAAELDRMAAHHNVTVVECDASVRAVYPYRGRITRVHGRGGTDLRPPFDAALLGSVKPDLVIYFTDGCGPAPDRPPAIPVLWCLTPGGQRPAPWGRAIHLSS